MSRRARHQSPPPFDWREWERFADAYEGAVRSGFRVLVRDATQVIANAGRATARAIWEAAKADAARKGNR